MKKVLAVLLAVLMAFSVCVVCVSAEDGGASGTVYKLEDGIGRIKTKNNYNVTILQGGDRIEFSTVGNVSGGAQQEVIVQYYPDAASISMSAIKNVDWKENQVAKYNLDSSKWVPKDGQTTADLMAKSPNYFKLFVTSELYSKGEVSGATIAGLGDLAHAKDAGGIDRGDLENGNPIDYALSGAKFVGWAVSDITDPGSGNKKKTIYVNVYALWERGAAPEQPSQPDKPDNPKPGEEVKYDTPIQATFAKWMEKIDGLFEYINILPGVPVAIAKFLNDGFRSWIYGLFGIEA